jgi:formylglycine-generating enzyme required for sulfatase activity
MSTHSSWVTFAALILVAGCSGGGDDDTAGDDDATAADDDATPLEIEGDEAGECDDGVDNDQDGVTDCADDGCVAATVCADADGDGWSIHDGDCDDGDAAFHPEADEGCDGLDNDCDGSPGEDEADADGDGVMICEGDCQDTEASLFPGALLSVSGIDFSFVCAGLFSMGSAADEAGRDADETAHTVTLTHDLHVGRTEVTQSQFVTLMGYHAGFHAGCPDCPAEHLNWNEAALLANTLSANQGLDPCYSCVGAGHDVKCQPGADPYACEGFRLPTEAEWEYVARAGQTSSFSAGGDLTMGSEMDCGGGLALDDGTVLDDLGWFCGNTTSTQPVGQKSPNAWGLHDTVGNVWEWCHDWSGPYMGAVTDPMGTANGHHRIVRGGSWRSEGPCRLRVANRSRRIQRLRCRTIGMRLVQTYAP